jgi:large subunit ribosomal protein L6
MLEKNLRKNEISTFFDYSLKFVYTKTEKFLVFQNKDKSYHFIKIPSLLYIEKNKQKLKFKLVSSHRISFLFFFNFQKLLGYLIKTFNKKYKKILIIKGLGMRINYLSKSHILELKLGFSHLIYVAVPTTLKIYKNKNLLTVEGYSSSLVGNFAYLIQSFRFPDSYKGKGIWYKNQIFKLKIVKKT